jgi:hypothetical protein
LLIGFAMLMLVNGCFRGVAGRVAVVAAWWARVLRIGRPRSCGRANEDPAAAWAGEFSNELIFQVKITFFLRY